MKILITGGASGLGKAITVRMAQDSQNLIYITYNNSTANAEDLEAQFSNVKAIKCDFRERSDVSSLIEQVESLDLDILINNGYSGKAIRSHFNKIPESDFLDDFNTNILPAVLITQAVINSFRRKKSGKIITILTSFLHSIPPLGSALYVANKGYLKELVKAWAGENVKYNISSNSISPSFMLTNMASDVDERVVEQMEQNHPLKRILTVEEVADTAHFLINSSNQINGIDIKISAASN